MELNFDSRIGATFGKAYCGVVGGVRRHEYAVLGPSVNLAARLMCSDQNKGVLVDDVIRHQAKPRFVFKSLPAIKAKGYSDPVNIFEPMTSIDKWWCQPTCFNGIETIVDGTEVIHESGYASTMALLQGELIGNVVLEELCLQRIDLLEIKTRRIVQSCAVLGNQFTLSDVINANPELNGREMILNAFESAVAKNIMIEVPPLTPDGTTNDGTVPAYDDGDRTFRFSHGIWRTSILKIMLNERKEHLATGNG